MIDAPDIQRTYEPRGGALECLRAREKEVLCEGPARTGKTRGLLEKAYIVAQKYPGSRQMFVRKTRASMTETIMQTFEDDVLTPDDRRIMGQVKRYVRRDYIFPNGSVVVLAGMDTPDRIMSSEYDRIYVFEATELLVDDYEKLVSRLTGGRTAYNQIVCDCNPHVPSHWLNARASTPSMRRIRSRLEDNPRWHTGTDWTAAGVGVRDTLDRLTGHRKLRLVEGRWAAAEGLVYDTFDASVHCVSSMPDGWRSWRKVRLIDFGYTNPFCCQWWAIDGDGRAWLYREIYRVGRTVAQHAKQITALSEGEEYEATIADHDAEDRATLRECGIHTIAASKAVTRNVQLVTDRLARAGNGKPRLMFCEDSLVEIDHGLREDRKPFRTVQEFDCYQWPQTVAGKSMKENPVKEHDHGMDCIGYLCAYLENPQRPLLYVVGDDTPAPGSVHRMDFSGFDHPSWEDDA